MTFGFSQVTDVANKAERFLKIAKAEVSFDTPSSRNSQFGVCDRNRSASSCVSGGMPPGQGVAFLLGERLGHVWTFG
jgi:hypothetical protein